MQDGFPFVWVPCSSRAAVVTSCAIHFSALICPVMSLPAASSSVVTYTGEVERRSGQRTDDGRAGGAWCQSPAELKPRVSKHLET